MAGSRRGARACARRRDGQRADAALSGRGWRGRRQWSVRRVPRGRQTGHDTAGPVTSRRRHRVSEQRHLTAFSLNRALMYDATYSNSRI